MYTEFRAKVILDSIAPCDVRLTTMEWTYPRLIHSEFMTHRDRERNAASSRAIPFVKMLDQVRNHPYIPIHWGMEQKGMQSGEEIQDKEGAIADCLELRDAAIKIATRMHNRGVHKSICNRYLEPWAWITVVITATEWKNLFRLRIHPDAERAFQKVAMMAREALEKSTPVQFAHNQRHLPYIVKEDFEEKYGIIALTKMSVARISRVSYLTQDGIRNPDKDFEQYDRLITGSGFGHWSPFGHVADATNNRNYRSGPFRGWKQFRKEFANENVEG